MYFIFTEFLVEALFFSVDPYMRSFSRRSLITEGSTMVGSQVAKYLSFERLWLIYLLNF